MYNTSPFFSGTRNSRAISCSICMEAPATTPYSREHPTHSFCDACRVEMRRRRMPCALCRHPFVRNSNNNSNSNNANSSSDNEDVWGASGNYQFFAWDPTPSEHPLWPMTMWRGGRAEPWRVLAEPASASSTGADEHALHDQAVTELLRRLFTASAASAPDGGEMRRAMDSGRLPRFVINASPLQRLQLLGRFTGTSGYQAQLRASGGGNPMLSFSRLWRGLYDHIFGNIEARGLRSSVSEPELIVLPVDDLLSRSRSDLPSRSRSRSRSRNTS